MEISSKRKHTCLRETFLNADSFLWHSFSVYTKVDFCDFCITIFCRGFVVVVVVLCFVLPGGKDEQALGGKNLQMTAKA